MSDDLRHPCAELAALIPALIPALSCDDAPHGRTGLSAGSAVNPDVLHAMIILAAEIPAACAAACEVAGEPWQPRPSAICLRAIPRLHHRLTALGMLAAATDLVDWHAPLDPDGETRARPPRPNIPDRPGLKPLITGSPPRGLASSASSKLSPIRRPASTPWRRTGLQRTAYARLRRRAPRRRT